MTGNLPLPGAGAKLGGVKRRAARWLPALLCLGALGCAKKAELYEDRDWTQETEARSTAWREVESLFGSDESDVDRGNYILRGVRHDLTVVKEGTVDAHCSCLDVTVGRPEDGDRFRWTGEIPIISPDETAVAVRTEGSRCGIDTGPGRRRPSIYAVDYTNGNTIVVIEELPLDRPQALGAIVDLPAPGEGLYVRSRRFKDHVLPYGQGTVATSGMCKVMTRGRALPKAL